MTRTWLPLFCVALLGCPDKPDPTDVEDTQPQTVTFETGEFVDTAVPSDTGDTGDTGAVDGLTSLTLYPDDLVVHTGAVFPLRTLGTWHDGAVEELQPTYASSDTLVATVDKDGVVTAVGPGTVTLSATATTNPDDRTGGALVEDTVTLTVADDGQIHVTVVSAAGEPLPGVQVQVNDGESYTTDKDGIASLPVDDGGPVEVSAYSAQVYVPATIWGTVSRNVTIPLHDREVFWADNARLEGSVDFSSLDDGSVGDMTLALVVPSFQYGPLLIEPRDLVAENRSVTIYGMKTEIPANLSLKEHAEGYAASTPADSGIGATWAIGGTMPIGDILAALDSDASDTESALALLGEHMADLRWGWDHAEGITPGETALIDVRPSVSFSERISVTAGPLPGGFAGTERPLLMIGSVLPVGGVMVTGLGLGTDTVEIRSIPAGTIDSEVSQVAMAIAQVGGLGSGGAITSAWAPVSDAEATLPLYQNTGQIREFDAVSRRFSLWTDPRSTYVQLLLKGGDGHSRIVYVNGGDIEGILHNPRVSMGYASVHWRVLSLETTTDTFEGLARRGDLIATELATQAWSSTFFNTTTTSTE